MRKAERRASPDPRYYVRRSEPAGRRDLRAKRKITANGHVSKPRSWPTRFWFRSKLFDRGTPSRRIRFRKLLADIRGFQS